MRCIYVTYNILKNMPQLYISNWTEKFNRIPIIEWWHKEISFNKMSKTFTNIKYNISLLLQSLRQITDCSLIITDWTKQNTVGCTNWIGNIFTDWVSTCVIFFKYHKAFLLTCRGDDLTWRMQNRMRPTLTFTLTFRELWRVRSGAPTSLYVKSKFHPRGETSVLLAR